MNPRAAKLAKAAGIAENSQELELFFRLVVIECAAQVQNFVDRRIPASDYPAMLRDFYGVEKLPADVQARLDDSMRASETESIPLELTNEELFDLFLEAHRRNLTLDQLCSTLLEEYINEQTKKDSEK